MLRGVSTLWPLSLQQRLDRNGRPQAGAKAYFYETGTLTARTVYSDPGLSTPHAQPVVADTFGAFPAVFPPLGQYRCRVVTSSGSLIFDVELDGGAEAVVGGGGTDPDLLIKTGFIVAKLKSGTETSYVRLNGRTIGNASSGATERANADCENLFVELYNSLSNTIAPVSGGRSGTAATDFAAGKTLTLPNAQGRALIGLNGMGGTAANLLSALTFTLGDQDTPGSAVGAGTHTLTEAQLPVVNRTPAGSIAITDPGHAHAISPSAASNNNNAAASGSTVNAATSGASATQTAATGISATFTGTQFTFGSGSAHPNVQPSMTCTFYIKL